MDNQRITQLLSELLNEISRSQQQNAAIIDQMNPTYSNVIDIHQWIYDIQNEQRSMRSQLGHIENLLQQLINSQK